MTSKLPQLQIKPAQTQIKSSQSLDFVVRLRAPEAPEVATPTNRTPLNISICIDASGSMRGKPLMDAKLAAQAFFDRLEPEDRISLVGYGSFVKTWLETTSVEQAREAFKTQLAALDDGGMTALHEGWLAAANTLAPFATPERLSRVILLSDGQANQGITDVNEIEIQARRLYDAGISTSTYGLGMNFDEDLMTRLAVGGNAFYASSADELLPYFENEFKLISQTVATQIKAEVQIQDTRGKSLLKLDLLNLSHQNKDQISMSSLVYGADSWLAFHLPEGQDLKGNLKIEVKMQWVSAADHQIHHQNESLEIKVGARASKINEEIKSRCDEARASRLQFEAAQAAKMGDIQGATRALNNIKAFAGANAYLCGVTQTLENTLLNGDLGSFSKEARYSSSAMSSRVASQTEDYTKLDKDEFGLRKAVQGKSDGSK